VRADCAEKLSSLSCRWCAPDTAPPPCKDRALGRASGHDSTLAIVDTDQEQERLEWGHGPEQSDGRRGTAAASERSECSSAIEELEGLTASLDSRSVDFDTPNPTPPAWRCVHAVDVAVSCSLDDCPLAADGSCIVAAVDGEARAGPAGPFVLMPGESFDRLHSECSQPPSVTGSVGRRAGKSAGAAAVHGLQPAGGPPAVPTGETHCAAKQAASAHQPPLPSGASVGPAPPRSPRGVAAGAFGRRHLWRPETMHAREMNVSEASSDATSDAANLPCSASLMLPGLQADGDGTGPRARDASNAMTDGGDGACESAESDVHLVGDAPAGERHIWSPGVSSQGGTAGPGLSRHVWCDLARPRAMACSVMCVVLLLSQRVVAIVTLLATPQRSSRPDVAQ
jgi:hypothetical protein